MIVDEYFSAKVITKAAVDLYFDARVSIPIANLRYANMQITLGSKTLSDTYSGTTYKEVADVQLDDFITGSLKDMSYKFRVDSVSLSGSQINFTGRYNSNDLLYTDLYIAPNKNDRLGYHNNVPIFRLSTWFNLIADKLGFVPKLYGRDYAVASDSANSKGSYQNHLQQLFGSFGDLPVCDYNVFIRGNNLFAVQRGCEKDVIEDGLGTVVVLTNAGNVKRVPAVTVTRMRTETGITYEWPANAPGPEDIVESKPEPFTGEIAFGSARLVYLDGYLQQRVEGNKTTTYTYKDINEKKYLWIEEIIDTQAETANKTEHEYYNQGDVLYLAVEKRYTGGAIVQGVPSYTDAVIVTTTHSPLGNGWYGITTTNESTGDVQTSLSQGASANAVNQYTIDNVQQNLGGFADIQKGLMSNILAKLLGVPIINTNWNIDGAFGRSDIGYFAGMCDWLNGAVQEQISMDVVDVDHIIDFTDIISYEGKYYCLESNSVRHDKSGIQQSISIVRWFKGGTSYPSVN